MAEILLKYLQLAETEIDQLIEKRKSEVDDALCKAKVSGVFEYGSTSEVESVSANVYGASGSCAGMSDDEVTRIKAPPVPVVHGRPRTKRRLSLLDKIKKKNKNKNKAGDTADGVSTKGKKNKKGTKGCTGKKKTMDGTTDGSTLLKMQNCWS